MNIEELATHLKLIDVNSTKLQYDMGWNNALIYLMRGTDHNIVRRIQLSLPPELTGEQLSVIVKARANDQKLHAVKEFKDYMGLGLKDAKDIIDVFWTNITKEECASLKDDFEFKGFSPV